MGCSQAVAANGVTTKMAKQTQLQQEMTKDLKKVEVGKRLAEYNHRKREELAKSQKIEREPKLTSSQCYGARPVVAIGVLRVLGCYIY